MNEMDTILNKIKPLFELKDWMRENITNSIIETNQLTDEK